VACAVTGSRSPHTHHSFIPTVICPTKKHLPDFFAPPSARPPLPAVTTSRSPTKKQLMAEAAAVSESPLRDSMVGAPRAQPPQ